MLKEIKPVLELGQVLTTAGVAADMEKDDRFAALVQVSLSRHQRGDWGTICNADKKTNDEGLKNGGRVMSAYTIDESKGISKGFGENTIWIITEWDRSVTTILYPNEY